MPDDRYVDVPVRVMNVQQQPHLVKAGTTVSVLEDLDLVADVSNKNLAADSATYVNSVSVSSVTEAVLDYIQKLVAGVDGATPEGAVAGLRRLLLSNRHVFSQSENDLGRTDLVAVSYTHLTLPTKRIV